MDIPFDMDLALTMENYWTSFAKTGQPIGKEGDPVWSKCVEGGDCDYVYLASHTSEKRNGFERCDFWDDLMDGDMLSEQMIFGCYTASALSFNE